jgi:WS/DGAT/MGAT family acyltransferase
MRRLSGVDADMLYVETPACHMHVAALLVIDPSTAQDGFDFDSWRALLARQIEHLPPLRERLVEVPFGIDRPLWIEDADFDLDRHLRHAAVPAPGGDRELAALSGELLSHKLDRSGPLWEMWFIDGLAGGRVGVLTKLHHACADGMAGAMMMGRMFSLEPEPVPPPPSASDRRPSERTPSDVELLARGLGSLALAPLRTAKTVGKTLGSVGDLLRWRRLRAGDAPALPFQAPRTSLNRPLTPHRSFANARVPLAALKSVKNAFDVKLNDVVIAVCAGALRRFLEARGELPSEPLIAAIPVDTRSEQEMGGLGNVVSGMFTNLATDVDDPVERLQAVSAGTRSAKGLYALGIEDVVMDWAALPIPAAVGPLVRLFSWTGLTERLPPIFNLLISNVQGPPVPLYAGGARVVGCYPMGPVIDQVGLNVTVLSYMDIVEFGLLACRDLVPDLWAIADAIPETLEELVIAAKNAG